MSDLANLIAQLSGSNQQPASDPAMAAVKLARASIDALVLKLGKTIDARVVGQLAAGLTQLTAGSESFVLKLETPLPTGTAVTIKVMSTPQGTPAVTVAVPSAPPQAAQPLPLPTPTAPLVQAQVQQPASPTPAAPQNAVQTLPQATQLPLPEPAPQPAATPAARPPAVPVQQAAAVLTAPAAQPAAAPQPPAPVMQPLPGAAAPPPAQANTVAAPPPISRPLPTPGQPAAQVSLPVAPLPTGAPPAATPVVVPPPATIPPVVATAPPVPAAAQAPAAIPAQPAATPTPAAQPVPVPATPLTAQPPQPLPTHPSPYPVQAAPAATSVAAPQLPLSTAPAATAIPRPAAPPLNLADPAQAAARQDSAAPLLARLAAIVTAVAPSLPRPVLEVAQRVLANRVDLNRSPPDAKTLEAAVLKAGVLLTPLTRDAPADSKSALLALRSTLLAFLGGDAAGAVVPTERPAPPIKGEPPRAPAPQVALPDPSADGHDTARSLLGHTDAALSRLKLLQAASQPAADARIDAAPRNELRVEIPMLLGAETGILQLLVERDGKHKRAQRERGWRMRFAMSFSATGEVGADIAMLGRSASVAIWAADPVIADALDEMLPELGPAIQRHGLELTSLRVRRGAPRPAPTAPGQLLDSAR